VRPPSISSYKSSRRGEEIIQWGQSLRPRLKQGNWRTTGEDLFPARAGQARYSATLGCLTCINAGGIGKFSKPLDRKCHLTFPDNTERDFCTPRKSGEKNAGESPNIAIGVPRAQKKPLSSRRRRAFARLKKPSNQERAANSLTHPGLNKRACAPVRALSGYSTKRIRLLRKYAMLLIPPVNEAADAAHR